VLCQLSYAPELPAECSPGSCRTTVPEVQRRLLGFLFVALAVGLALVAVFAALEGGSAWVIALAAAALAMWLGDLGRRALGRRRA
jgi:hypothetical protein